MTSGPSFYCWSLLIVAWLTSSPPVRAAFTGSSHLVDTLFGTQPFIRDGGSPHNSFGGGSNEKHVGKLSATTSSNTDERIDFQADSSQFGRGEMHLSALLEEGDVVAYQTGTWFVDGVQVGDEDHPSLAFCRIETIQLVWTHNCEHGVLRGMELVLVRKEDDETNSSSNMLKATGDVIEFGPEQLIARFPVVWEGADCVPLVELEEDNWLIR